MFQSPNKYFALFYLIKCFSINIVKLLFALLATKVQLDSHKGV